MSSLAGRTVFITGASRGIGKAIALRCAEDGANIVIAAKTAERHPKLPGTIYTAAKEIETSGGKCLPCVVDIRDEEQVKQAVDLTLKTFGGIDILVNNASAIQLTNTVDTSMKRYDLMMSVNVRGTYLCSKYCIPHLKNGRNPHILNISPPLSLNTVWFKDHVAYSIAKYGMSLCVLGMSEELRADGIAVNALWPKTAIYTAASEMLGGGEAVKQHCRRPEIMADAAYAILTSDSHTYTVNFDIDEDVLRCNGVTGFQKYSYYEDSKLIADLFVDNPEGLSNLRSLSNSEATVAHSSHTNSATSGTGVAIADAELARTFSAIHGMISEDVVKSINALYIFDLKDSGKYFVDLKNLPGGCGNAIAHTQADVTMTLSRDDFIKMFAGQMNPTSAFMTGRLKVKGDLGLAMKLEKMLKNLQAKL